MSSTAAPRTRPRRMRFEQVILSEADRTSFERVIVSGVNRMRFERVIVSGVNRMRSGNVILSEAKDLFEHEKIHHLNGELGTTNYEL
ncbi:MAG TPA: hypothetical protein VFY79_12655 [Dehalococcoidia bacterium]|nr:hypothetical protein [Dehalococcoidia bacterium]